MSSKYWIKLYHEIIDDPKMMKMPDVLFARCIKIFLLAGDAGDDGQLPGIEDCAWRLRISAEEMESDFIELQKLGILAQTDGVWRVRKWEERQGPMSGAERVQRFRDERRKKRYQTVGPGYLALERADTPTDTGLTLDSNEAETKRYTDKEEIRRDKEEEEIKNAPASSTQDIIRIISHATGMVAIPPKENQRIEQIWSLLDAYGEEKVTSALKRNYERWCSTRTEDGRFYKRTNFGWVDWAMEELSGGESVGKPLSFIEELRANQ